MSSSVATSFNPFQVSDEHTPTAISESPIDVSNGSSILELCADVIQVNPNDFELHEKKHNEANVTELPPLEDVALVKPLDKVPIPLPRSKAPEVKSRFVLLQKWEGTVLQTRPGSFLGRLVDLQGEHPDDEAEIPVEELSPEDLDLVKVGAVFYWSIGYLDEANGERRRTSVIRFRRLPAWSKEELRRARRQATRAIERIGWK